MDELKPPSWLPVEVEDDCWIDTFHRNQGQFNRISRGGKCVSIRRAVVDHFWNPNRRPGHKFKVRTKCGNASCVHPDHLTLRAHQRQKKKSKRGNVFSVSYRDSDGLRQIVAALEAKGLKPMNSTRDGTLVGRYRVIRTRKEIEWRVSAYDSV